MKTKTSTWFHRLLEPGALRTSPPPLLSPRYPTRLPPKPHFCLHHPHTEPPRSSSPTPRSLHEPEPGARLNARRSAAFERKDVGCWTLTITLSSPSLGRLPNRTNPPWTRLIPQSPTSSAAPKKSSQTLSCIPHNHSRPPSSTLPT